MTNISILRVNMIKTGTVDIGRRHVGSHHDAGRIIRTILDKEYQGGMPDREVFGVLFLDRKYQVNGVEFAAIGSIDSAIVHPREVFKAAILHNASSIILFHNHPSGNSTPSPADINVTQRLMEAGEILGINVLDHLLMGDNTFTSLKQREFI